MKKTCSIMISTLIIAFISRPLKLIFTLSLVTALTFWPGFFTLSAQVWTQVGSDIDGEAADDQSGSSVSASADGKRIAIGAYLNDGNGGMSGHVRVYSENAGVWSQVGSDINGEAGFTYSGYSVSLTADGKNVAIGAIWNDGSGTDAGHVRVYKESGGVWSKVGGDIDGEAANDWSGYSVSISDDGKRVAIGALQNDGNGADAGHVRVYKLTGSNWTKVGNDIDGEAADDHFGRSVSISSDGKRLAIGAGGNDGNGAGAGHVRVYSESGGAWTQLGGDIDGEAAGDVSGYSVSLSADGRRVAIGAVFNDGGGTDAGHVRVFSESSGIWSKVGADIDGEGPDDRFGSSVSLSADGKRIAIGANLNDASGSAAGHVRMYVESGGAWMQLGADIDGEAAGDGSGTSVSLSRNGQRVAIGAELNDGNGISSGHVRVYKETPCDADMDGYDNTVCGGPDCNDNDASINPGATEACNGVDDNCDGTVDEGTADADGDSVCDVLDNCPGNVNTDQADTDGDDIGDVCDACPNDPDNDADNDGICGEVDNCPSMANAGQEDSDCDTVGDACDICPGGDDRIDNNNDGISDCSQLLNYNAYSSAWKCGTNKIYVCHSGATQCISKNQLSTHYGHGDNIGPCVSCGGQNFSIPESNIISFDVDASGLTIFPNPADKEVTLYLSDQESATVLTICNQLGQVIWTQRIEEGQIEIQINLEADRFWNGVYLVSAVSNAGISTQWLIIAR